MVVILSGVDVGGELFDSGVRRGERERRGAFDALGGLFAQGFEGKRRETAALEQAGLVRRDRILAAPAFELVAIDVALIVGL
jgi:hypothetical protein